MHRALPLLAVALAMAGCGGDAKGSRSHAARAAAAPQPLTGCGKVDPGWHKLDIATSDGTAAATLGAGAFGVVFANESGGSACGWTEFAQDLARAGHPVAVTDGPGDAKRMLAAAVALRVQGAKSVILVGASVGGRAVLQAAAVQPDAVLGVVSLSGERTVTSDQHDLITIARHIQLPVLFIGSREDGYTNFGADTRALHRAVPAKINGMLLVSGGDHGVDLLADKHAGQVRSWIEHFLSVLSIRSQG
jgi:hypothetical protein